ncbi:unnamed protein product [Arctogadus glacialis]
MAVVQGAALSAITTADFELGGPLSAPSACPSVVVTAAAEPSLLIQRPPVRGGAVQREHAGGSTLHGSVSDASVQPQQTDSSVCIYTAAPAGKHACEPQGRRRDTGAGT